MWTINEITRATGGTAQGNPANVTSVSIDSRNIIPGALFVALKGERADGHEFVRKALEKGAAAALVSHVPEGLDKNAPLIVVKDTYKALVDMAKASRARSHAKIIAVTGSVGKTSTKEAIRIALSSRKVFATQGNFNNHIGLPLSLANLSADIDFGVFELGMNHAGEISFLTNILRPDIAVITNVEAAHLEFFASVEKIADAKAEIMEGLGKDGVLILSRDNAYYEYLRDKAKARNVAGIVTFGEHWEADFRLTRYEVREFGSQIEAVAAGMPITYRLGTVGRHWAFTSLAALAAITAAGIYLPDAAVELANFHEPEGRGKTHLATIGKGTVTLIDDCYNASPASMNAAIAKLGELHSAISNGGRKVAVLGDMLELGENSADLHKGLRSELERHGVNKLYAVGPLMKHLYESLPAPMRGAYATTAGELARTIVNELKDKDIVLIKGSHGSRMDIVRDAITQKRELADAV